MDTLIIKVIHAHYRSAGRRKGQVISPAPLKQKAGVKSPGNSQETVPPGAWAHRGALYGDPRVQSW